MEMYELRDRLSTLPALRNRLEAIQRDMNRAEDEVAALLGRYERESRDVERMKEESFSKFLYRLIGKYEDKLEKEQSEEISAKLAYDRAVARRNALVGDRDALTAQIKRLEEEKQTYEAELDNRRHIISAKLTGPEGGQYKNLCERREAVISQMTEVTEARKAVSRAVSTAAYIAELLDSAEGWATYDAFFGGGIISHMAKYSHIDKAEENFSMLSHELRTLKTELSDVEGLTAAGLTEISSAQRTVDFWFDNIFTDLSVRGQIRDNAAQISGLIHDLNSVDDALDEKRRNLESVLAENRQCEEELLLSLTQRL